jgi:hypothetical protein
MSPMLQDPFLEEYINNRIYIYLHLYTGKILGHARSIRI